MALNKDSVKQARKVLKLINRSASFIEIECFDSNEKYLDTNIYLINKKADGSFESVITNIFEMTEMQRELWNTHKESVRNNIIEKEFEEFEITRIGWT